MKIRHRKKVSVVMTPATSFRSHIALALLLFVTTGWSCPMCSDAVTTSTASNSGGASIESRARGYYYSIVGMVSVPFLAVGGIAWALARDRRAAGMKI